MKILRIFIAIFILMPIIAGFGWQFGTLWHDFTLSGTQLWFWCSFSIAFLLFLIFLPQSAYISILKHELIHNLFALLTLKKPEGIRVNRGKGGEFNYSGSSNPFIILSPYFFPILTVIFMLIFLFGLKNTRWFFLFFGIACAFDMVTSLKDTHLKQTDLKKYGLFFSMALILAFWLLNWGFVFHFVFHQDFSQIGDYFLGGLQKIKTIFVQLYLYLSTLF